MAGRHIDALKFLPGGIWEVLKDGEWHGLKDFVPLFVRIPGKLASRRFIATCKAKIASPLWTRIAIGRERIMMEYLDSMVRRQHRAERRKVEDTYEFRAVPGASAPRARFQACAEAAACNCHIGPTRKKFDVPYKEKIRYQAVDYMEKTLEIDEICI